VGLVFRHPEPGERVGDYRIMEKLGSGGFGTAFKAERTGLLFTVKMLRSSTLGARERREIGILLLLDLPGVARFRACDRWLDPKIGTPYIVTDFVPGLTLEEFAEVQNPSARKAARIILESALTLGEVHLQGVFHRDLKPENIIIHGKNERPVLIDFGVGTYAGAPVITPHGLPPGTYEFRAPEAYLFQRANAEFAHYEFSAADELWALGVTFYWLLTNVLPFGDRNQWEGGGLAKRILHLTPVAPHVLNPRVPRALSDICMKMLEKKPEDRYASVVELGAALGSAMADAELDGKWDLPLFDPDAPDTRTTEEDPARVDANEDEATRMFRKWAKARPRRGRKPKREAEPASEQDDIPTVAAEPNPDDGSPVEARPKKPDALPVNVPEALAAAMTRAVPQLVKEGLPSSPEKDDHDPKVEAPQASTPPEAPRATAAPRPPVSRRRTRLVAAAAVVLLGVALVATLLSRPESAPPHTSSKAPMTQQAEHGHEVALSAKPPDPPVGEGAEPMMGSLSAPVMITMPHDTSEKPQEKKTKVLGRAGKALATGLVCTKLVGCPAPQVRPTPDPEPCPAGAVETMKTLGIDIGNQHGAHFTIATQAEYITVPEGETTLSLLRAWGKLPDRTLLSGRLIFGDGRVYGRLTEAKVPSGATYKVCLEARDAFKGGRGVIREPDGGPESARVWGVVDVRAVSSFE
jgi:serine/threonine-protein kinase